MLGLIQTLLGLVAAMIWLVLLVATQFNVLTISAGLLAALYITGRPTRKSTA